jgi:hypothetical protein
LKSIPGFGPYVSAVALASIGNPHRFENRAQLIRQAGFDLSAIKQEMQMVGMVAGLKIMSPRQFWQKLTKG